ncbi:integrase family protein [Actinobacteria bacterium OV450]|nr:integrase family protein [Actinobacteria bacterium OV450]
MASVVERKDKHGNVSSYQVKWRLGGKADADWQTERFAGDDLEVAAEAAAIFKKEVDAAGQQWPLGWVKGKGYVAAEGCEESDYRFETYARNSIANRTAGSYYKRQRIRAMEMYLLPTFANCDIRSTEHFSKATLGVWVNQMRATMVRQGGGEPKPMSNGTLRGLLKLLSSVLEEATMADPPLRARNPCRLIRLGNGHSTSDDSGSGDLMEFMRPEEIAGIISCFSRASDRMLVRTAYGTGLRWGEITALEGRHLRDPGPGEYEVQVAQAWKRYSPKSEAEASAPGSGEGLRSIDWRLGPPKSEAGVRTVEITKTLWQELQDFGVAELDMKSLIFRGPDGTRIIYGTFWERWNNAVKKAKKLKLLPAWRMPTFHDLRHSHVAVLLSERHSLTYVQRRLGHETITTTSDRYGHLLDTASKAALDTLERVMGAPLPVAGGAADRAAAPEAPEADGGAADRAAVPGPRGGDDGGDRSTPARLTDDGLGATPAGGRVVYVAHMGVHEVPFWGVEDAERTAERWVRERGGSVHVETSTSEAWTGEEVRALAPGRAWVWEIGPVVYAADGSEVDARPGAAEARGAWKYDFEDGFTAEAARFAVEQWADPETRTLVRAWGRDEQCVLAAFAEARTDALRLCAVEPAAADTEA